jgi:glycosyltransferase involved in cell wall biosynthesis
VTPGDRSEASTVKEVEALSVFFPCFNDQGTIASMVIKTEVVLERLGIDTYEIIVVDDGSSDESLAILHRLARNRPWLRIVEHGSNRGYGAALRSGFAACRYDWIFYTDGDFQYDVADLERLVEAAAPDVDWVQGFKVSRHDPLHRRVIGRIYHHFVAAVFGIRVRDTDCDFRLIRRSLLDKVELHHDSGVICVEMMRKFQDAGGRVREVPVNHYFRAYGRSQFFNLRRLWRTGLGLLSLWLELVGRPRFALRRPSRSKIG